MKTIVVLAALFLFAGCASTATHLYGTEGIPPERLAKLTYNDNEIILLEVDGKAFSGRGYQFVYMKPGIHKIKAKLNWRDTFLVGGAYLTTTQQSKSERTGCIEFEQGGEYVLYASDASPNWRLHMARGLSFKKGRDAVPECQ